MGFSLRVGLTEKEQGKHSYFLLMQSCLRIYWQKYFSVKIRGLSKLYLTAENVYTDFS